jgi:hypothetical protein
VAPAPGGRARGRHAARRARAPDCGQVAPDGTSMEPWTPGGY